MICFVGDLLSCIVIEGELGLLFRIHCYNISNSEQKLVWFVVLKGVLGIILACNGRIFKFLTYILRHDRMLHSVRGEPSRFDMVPGNVEELDRAINEMDNVLTTGLFQVLSPFPQLRTKILSRIS